MLDTHQAQELCARALSFVSEGQAEVRVDDGVIMKRMMPRARGRADRRLHRTSHLIVKVSDQK